MDAKHLKQLRRSVAHEPRVYCGLVVVSIVVTVLALGAFQLVLAVVAGMLGYDHGALSVVMIIAGATLCAASILLMLLITRRTTDTIINRRLADRHCPWCDYDLGGIDADHCPECGRPGLF